MFIFSLFNTIKLLLTSVIVVNWLIWLLLEVNVYKFGSFFDKNVRLRNLKQSKFIKFSSNALKPQFFQQFLALGLEGCQNAREGSRRLQMAICFNQRHEFMALKFTQRLSNKNHSTQIIGPVKLNSTQIWKVVIISVLSSRVWVANRTWETWRNQA